MQKSVTDRGSHLTHADSAHFPIIIALTFSHFLNDVMQSLIPAIYPLIKTSYGLDFGQIGLITLAFQLTASLLQPLVGAYTDRKPQAFSTVVGMASTLLGLLVLAKASSYGMLIVGAALVGTGSSIFHPEAVRMARAASGGRHGFTQSLFQVGGQTGQAFGPLLAAFIVVPKGQASLAWFSAIALVAMAILFWVGGWYQKSVLAHRKARPLVSAGSPGEAAPLSVSQVSASPMSVSPVSVSGGASKVAIGTLVILLALMFSKSAYSASLSNFLTFYMIDKFAVSVQTSQFILFGFLGSQVIGSLIGGHFGDRFGRREIIWFSILGAMPFTLMLPFAGLTGSIVLTIIIGAIMASAFPAILVYAMELVPGQVGTVAGLFYGAAFGLGGLSAAILGRVADWTSLTTVYNMCAFLPLLGMLAWFLPKVEAKARA
jgi:MFS transporter, FSR family, fosmidomycin resistance protein